MAFDEFGNLLASFPSGAAAPIDFRGKGILNLGALGFTDPISVTVADGGDMSVSGASFVRIDAEEAVVVRRIVDAPDVGAPVLLLMNGGPANVVLAHSASLDLPGDTNLTLAAGDVVQITLVSGAWRLIGDVGGSSTPGSLASVHSFTGDGTRTEFGLNTAPNSILEVSAWVAGLYQTRGSAFALNGTTVIFSEAPPAGAAVELVVAHPYAGSAVPSSAVAIEAGANAGQSLSQALDQKAAALPSRAELVSAKDKFAVGTVVAAGGVAYRFVGGNVTTIKDLPGWVPEGDYTPLHFGAIGTGAKTTLATQFATLAEAQAVYPRATSLSISVDVAAIQACIDAVKVKAFDASPLVSSSFERALAVFMTFPAGKAFFINHSLDFTGIGRAGFSFWYVEARGAVFIAEGAGLSAFDFMHSRHMYWAGGEFIGSMTTPPRSMIMMGRQQIGTSAPDNEEVADHLHFTDIDIKGNFTLANVHNHASEESHFTFCTFRNDYDGAGEGPRGKSYCLVQDGDNWFGTNSLYAVNGPSGAAGVGRSFLQNVFDHCDFRHTGVGSAIWMNGTASHAFRTSYAVSEDEAAVVLFQNKIINGNSDLILDLHVETDGADVDATTGLDYGILFDTANSGTGFTCRGLVFRDNQAHAQVAVFAKTANVSAITMIAADVMISGIIRDVGQLLFESPGSFTVQGDFWIGAPTTSAYGISGLAKFTGRYVCPDVKNAKYHAPGQYTLEDPTNRVWRNGLSIHTAGTGVTDFSVLSPAMGTLGVLRHSAATSAWTVMCDGAAQDYQLTKSALYPNADNAYQLGLNNRRWSKVFARQIEMGPEATSVAWVQGSGSPEGVVTARPGSLYSNTSGSGAALYVKETGAGATGWVAK